MADQNIFDRPVLQRLYRYGCALCKDPDQAYDLLQHALEKYIRDGGKHNYHHDVAYVRTVMRNRFIDDYRRSKRIPEDSYDDTSPIAINEASLEDIVIAQIDLEIVWHKLDPFEREIMYYWAIEGMTAKEIAIEINVPRGTVLSRIHRLRKKIEAALDSSQYSRSNRP
jgi:RNA polymerase sigma-70 factor (ECF subfamily)